MGNCWRMPEDHSDLLYSSTPSFSSSSNPSDGPVPILSSSYSPTTGVTSENNTQPKGVIWDRNSTDSTKIKSAQFRNLIEHLQLIHFSENTTKQTDCDICLVEYLPDEELRQLPCDGAHVFHPSCIEKWFEKSLTCPRCSANIDAVLLVKFISHANSNDNDSDDD